MLYKNRTAEEKRVNDLLSRMTVDEKLAQLYMHQDPLEISKMIEEGTYRRKAFPQRMQTAIPLSRYSTKSRNIRLKTQGWGFRFWLRENPYVEYIRVRQYFRSA